MQANTLYGDDSSNQVGNQHTRLLPEEFYQKSLTAANHWLNGKPLQTHACTYHNVTHYPLDLITASPTEWKTNPEECIRKACKITLQMFWGITSDSEVKFQIEQFLTHGDCSCSWLTDLRNAIKNVINMNSSADSLIDFKYNYIAYSVGSYDLSFYGDDTLTTFFSNIPPYDPNCYDSDIVVRLLHDTLTWLFSLSKAVDGLLDIFC